MRFPAVLVTLALSVVDRRYAAHHVYRDPGEYDVRLSLRRAGRVVSAASRRVLVQSGGSF